jgi:hypothetical protein
METSQPSFLSPKLEVRQSHTGCGIFAVQAIAPGELLTVWGGFIVNSAQLTGLSDEQRSHTMQVEEDLYAVSEAGDPTVYFNHSCDPNAGLDGQIVLVALRKIVPDEEVCFDYAMCDGSPFDEFECHCGSTLCRKRVTGNDWQLPELWERYRGHFIPYLQHRIDRLKRQPAQIK